MSLRTYRAWCLAILTTACLDASGPRLPVATLELTPLQAWVGSLHQLTATPRSLDGTELNGRVITWTSSDPAIATVNESGNLSALAVGTTTITATCEEKTAQMTVAVRDVDLIYEGFPNGVSEMLVLSLSGGSPERVLPEGMIVTGPVPSPDGAKIAFVATTTAKTDPDIYVVNRDGSGLVRLTDSPEADDNPAWSPDGSKIAFRSFRDGRLGDIWVMSANGSSPVNLTPDPLPAVTDERRPAWSPDGTYIAFASNRGGTLDIWTMRSDGSDLLQVTKDPDYDTEPTWSPTGTQIAFRRSNDDISDLMVVGARGNRLTRLSAPGHELMPSWSPNGRIIAYSQFSPSGRNPQIYTVRPDGSERMLRTTNPTWNGGIEPRWIRK